MYIVITQRMVFKITLPWDGVCHGMPRYSDITRRWWVYYFDATAACVAMVPPDAAECEWINNNLEKLGEWEARLLDWREACGKARLF